MMYIAKTFGVCLKFFHNKMLEKSISTEKIYYNSIYMKFKTVKNNLYEW